MCAISRYRSVSITALLPVVMPCASLRLSWPIWACPINMPATAQRIGCLLILLIVTSPLQAEIYKWVDAEGTIHYTDTPPENQQQSLEITGRISSYDSPEI